MSTLLVNIVSAKDMGVPLSLRATSNAWNSKVRETIYTIIRGAKLHINPATLIFNTLQIKRVTSIDFTTDFKSIVKSTRDYTVKSSAFDLRLILLSYQL